MNKNQLKEYAWPDSAEETDNTYAREGRQNKGLQEGQKDRKLLSGEKAFDHATRLLCPYLNIAGCKTEENIMSKMGSTEIACLVALTTQNE